MNDMTAQGYPLYAVVSGGPGTVLNEVYAVLGWDQSTAEALLVGIHGGRPARGRPAQLFDSISAAMAHLDEVEAGGYLNLTVVEVS